jgi:hypothetical protein
MQHEPLDMFRKVTAFLYREIGVLLPSNHAEMRAKAIEQHGFFSPERKRIARDLYHQTKDEPNPRVVLKPYEDVTGLTLEDIYQAFESGDWETGVGRIYYGGPKWAAIAQATILLRDALLAEDHILAKEQTRRLDELEHNTGRLVEKFDQL